MYRLTYWLYLPIEFAADFGCKYFKITWRHFTVPVITIGRL